MSGPGDLYDAATEYLSACAAALALTDSGVPRYQAITPGPPIFDVVPALLIHVGPPTVADTYPLQPPLQPMQRGIAGGRQVNLITLTATVLRCSPTLVSTGQNTVVPTPAQNNLAASAVLQDVWSIWNYCLGQHRNGSLFQSLSGRREFAFDPALAINQQGAAAGWQVPLRIQMPGYSSQFVGGS